MNAPAYAALRLIANGWLAFRVQHLDPRVQKLSNRRVCLPDDAVDTHDLDEALVGQMFFVRNWLDRQIGYLSEAASAWLDLIRDAVGARSEEATKV